MHEEWPCPSGNGLVSFGSEAASAMATCTITTRKACQGRPPVIAGLTLVSLTGSVTVQVTAGLVSATNALVHVKVSTKERNKQQ